MKSDNQGKKKKKFKRRMKERNHERERDSNRNATAAEVVTNSEGVTEKAPGLTPDGLKQPADWNAGHRQHVEEHRCQRE